MYISIYIYKIYKITLNFILLSYNIIILYYPIILYYILQDILMLYTKYLVDICFFR